ncbi:hypothetical protein RI367_003910 [Sorochytrium milnesiophthora]
MSAAEATEPLYSREQIKIPDQLPDIIKNYAKHIIRTQPSNILNASAEYFRDLARQHQKDALSVTTEQLETLFAKLSPKPSYNVGRDVIDQVCEGARMKKSHVEELIKLGAWEAADMIDWFNFWSLSCAMSAGSLLSTLELGCTIMSNNDMVSTEYCIKMIQYLGSIDPDVNKDEIESCVALLGESSGMSSVAGVLDIVKSSVVHA